MNEIPPVVADCDRTFAAVQRLVDAVQPDQWTAPTPCTDWDVRQLLNHVANGNVVFAGVADRTRPSGPVSPEERAVDRLGDDLAERGQILERGEDLCLVKAAAPRRELERSRRWAARARVSTGWRMNLTAPP